VTNCGAIARLGRHWLWGEFFSGTHMLADAEVYRPVELGWLAILARFGIWDLMSEGTFHDE
jgi:hypothetical protein